LDRVFPLVYQELRRLAHRQLRAESTGHTLCTTALVHEAYLRLADQTRGQWRDRAHFLAIAAVAMRRILVDHARRHGSAKRGGSLRWVPLENADLAIEERAALLVALDDALSRLAALDGRQARVVECRFFGGMTEEETAEALYRRALEIEREVLPSKHANTATTLLGLGRLLMDRNQDGEAEPMLREALAIREEALVANHWGTAIARSALGSCLSRLGHHAEAEPLLVEGVARLRDALGIRDPRTQSALRHLANHYERVD
jgi:RNA polymerase sigma factor (TIGR02999 family)